MAFGRRHIINRIGVLCGALLLAYLSLGAVRTREGVFVIREADLAVAYNLRTAVAAVQLYIAPADRPFFRAGAIKSVKFYEEPTAFGPNEDPSSLVLECYAEDRLPDDISSWLGRAFRLDNKLDQTAMPREAFCAAVGLESSACPADGFFKVFDIESRSGRGKFYLWNNGERTFALAWKEPRRLSMKFYENPIKLRLWRASSSSVRETIDIKDRVYQVYFDHVHRLEGV